MIRLKRTREKGGGGWKITHITDQQQTAVIFSNCAMPNTSSEGFVF